jgi:ubiquitin-protein ligase E3 C
MLDEHAVERLPTAATCMNLLKLPPYRTAQQIRDKLLYAVQSGAGFELS